MNRIADTFERLGAEGRKGFIPFITAGDHSIAASFSIMRSLAESGADLIELGVPFSDPMADGPTIQASSQRALTNGTTVFHVLDLVNEFRKTNNEPIVLFSYLNPLLRHGIEEIAKRASDAKVDGILITDVVDGEACKIGRIFESFGIDRISLIAPTTTDERLQAILGSARGFVYAIARAGVTGARTDASNDAEVLVTRARRFTELPIAVGFGISTQEQVRDVWRYADAAVVGSAIVDVIESSDSGNVTRNVKRFVDGLLPQLQKHPVKSKV